MNEELEPIDTFVARIIQARKYPSALIGGSTLSQENISLWYEHSAPSDATIQNVLRVSFFASMLFEEGNTSRFTIDWPYFGATTLLKLQTPLDLTPSSLAKLAHATSEDTAIQVSSDPKLTQLVGVQSRMPEHKSIDPRDSMFRGCFGASIVVKDPGHLEYHEFGFSLSYIRGCISHQPSFAQVDLARKWIADADADIWSTAEQYFKGPIANRSTASCVQFVGTILKELISQRHGGMLIIVPTESPKDLEIRFKAESCSIRNHLARTWSELDVLWSDEGKEMMGVGGILFWRPNAERGLYRLAKSIAKMSHIDGAIVLTHDLELLGIGAIVSPNSGLASPNASEKLHGTRHASATRFCQATPGCLIFVVSQDGSLRFVGSDAAGNVSIHDNLSA